MVISLSPTLSDMAGYLVTSVAALASDRLSEPPLTSPSEKPRSNRRLLQGGLPFSLHRPKTVAWSLLLSSIGRLFGLSGPATDPAHAFTWHPALCSSDFPLPFRIATILRLQTLRNPIVACFSDPRSARIVKVALFRGRDSNPNLLIQSQLSYR